MTPFGKEMRNYSKEVVFSFDNAVKNNIAQDKLETFFEVLQLINDLIASKRIYVNQETSTQE